eukprot:1327317-Amorphochlora_amoeboformis.AAC.1
MEREKGEEKREREREKREREREKRGRDSGRERGKREGIEIEWEKESKKENYFFGRDLVVDRFFQGVVIAKKVVY